MGTKEFTILPPLEFISDVRREMEHAKKRLYLQAMEVEPGEIADHLLELLPKAKEKNLDARLHVDYYSFLVTDGVFNYLPTSKGKAKKREARLRTKKEYFKSLKEKGVQVTFTNPPSIITRVFPTFGRNHMKIAIVDDVAWIGGINYHDENFMSNDCMVKLTDPKIVDHVVTLFHQIEEATLKDDKRIHCTDETTLLVDSGKVGKSFILDEAIQLIEKAQESITVITPIIPDTRLARSLARAKKNGIQTKVLVPRIRKMKGIYLVLDLFNQISLLLFLRHVPVVFKNHAIHAKILIVDNEKVLLGSHNLTTRGVAMGTEELAIVSTNPHFLQQALSFMNHLHNK